MKKKQHKKPVSRTRGRTKMQPFNGYSETAKGKSELSPAELTAALAKKA